VEGVAVISVSDDGEFALIRRIVARLEGAPDLHVGPGDDAAVIAAPDGRVVATTDLMVEGRHFRRDWSTAYDVGRKAAAANLADVIAMGARPTALLVGLATPSDLSVEWADGLADGLRDEAAQVGAVIAGGDVVGSETLTIAVTALGDLGGRAPILRSGARPGDQVLLVGWPGRAAAGLALLVAGRGAEPLTGAHRRPAPPYQAGLALARTGKATAMIDTSDGLVADLAHLALASGVRIEITAAALPIASGLPEAAVSLGVDPLDWVLTGGDDHCFAATGDADDTATRVIGAVAALAAGESPGVVVTDRPTPTDGGFEHFAS
jgi:thiamine-monophosphate kinase